MVGQLLLRGMIAGLVAGFLAFCFAYVYGEPEVNYAIGLEEQKALAAGEDPGAEPELVSRSVQSTIGLGVGILSFGAAAGGVFSLVFGFAYGRLGNLGARATSALLAVAAYISVVIVPQVKYAPNPPAVGSPETIGARTSLFFMLLLISVAIMVLAIKLARKLWADQGPWRAGITAGVVWLVAIVVVLFAMPSVNEVPADFSADSLYRFRMVSLGIHAILWTVIGLLFGALAERVLERTSGLRPLAA